MAKMIELTTERSQEAALAPDEPRVVRVRYLRRWDGVGRWYLDGWPWPVPPVLRHLDGWTVRGVLAAAALATAAVVAGAWGLLRLAGRAR